MVNSLRQAVQLQLKLLLWEAIPRWLPILFVTMLLMPTFASILGMNTAVYSQAHDHIYIYKIQQPHFHDKPEPNVLIFPDNDMAHLQWNMLLPNVKITAFFLFESLLEWVFQDEFLLVDAIFLPMPVKPPR